MFLLRWDRMNRELYFSLDSLVLGSCTLPPRVLYSEWRTSGFRGCQSKPRNGPCQHESSPGPLGSKEQLLLQLLELVWMLERIKILWLFDSQDDG